jgi:hypothetical protein
VQTQHSATTTSHAHLIIERCGFIVNGHETTGIYKAFLPEQKTHLQYFTALSLSSHKDKTSFH